MNTPPESRKLEPSIHQGATKQEKRNPPFIDDKNTKINTFKELKL